MLMPVLMLAYYQCGMLCLYSDLCLEIQISYLSQITVSIQFFIGGSMFHTNISI